MTRTDRVSTPATKPSESPASHAREVEVDPAVLDREQALVANPTSPEAIKAYVEAAFPKYAPRAQAQLQALAAAHPEAVAPAHAAVVLALRVGDRHKIRSSIRRFLEMHPQDVHALSSIDHPGAAKEVKHTISIIRGEAEVIALRQSALAERPYERLVELREIIRREPLCYLAYKEHQQICERHGDLRQAEALYKQAQLHDEPHPNLALFTARVAFRAQDVDRGLDLLLKDPTSKARWGVARQVVKSAVQERPDSSAALRRRLTEARENSDDTEYIDGLLTAVAEGQKEAHQVGAKKPRQASRGALLAHVDWVEKLGGKEAAAERRKSMTQLRSGQSMPVTALFRCVLLQAHLGDLRATRAAYRELVKRAKQPEQLYRVAAKKVIDCKSWKDCKEAIAAVSAKQKGIQKPRAAKNYDRYTSPPGTRSRSKGDNQQSGLVAAVPDLVRGRLPTHPDLAAQLGVEAEHRVALKLIETGRSLKRRTAGVTMIAQGRVQGWAADRRKREWYIKDAVVYLHLLCGKAKSFAERSRDPVARWLRRAKPDTVGEDLAGSVVDSEHSPHLWDALVALGDAGYRLTDLPRLGPGFRVLDLEQLASEPSKAAPVKFIVVYGDLPETLEGVRKNLAHRLKASKTDPILLGVFSGESQYRLQTFTNLAGSYGAECVELASLRGDGVESTMRRARERAGNASNPIRAFPFRGQKLSTAQMVARPEVVERLQASLAVEDRPLAIHCMRKSGKTSTAMLLGLATNQDTTRSIIDLREHETTLRNDPAAVMRVLAEAEPLVHDRAGLLVLDEFDFFVRQLADHPESVAMEFLNWLVEAAEHIRVLCLGLDPEPLRLLYAASNPLQDLPSFRLRYFNEDECLALAHRMAGALDFDERLLIELYHLSGGHPGVLRGLMMWCIEVRFGRDAARIPLTESVTLDSIALEQLGSRSGYAARKTILRPVLNTRVGALGLARDAWSLFEYIATRLPPGADEATILDRADASDLGLQEDASVALELLLDWGLLLKNDTTNSVRTSIPLLRSHILREAKLEPNDEDLSV